MTKPQILKEHQILIQHKFFGETKITNKPPMSEEH
jgi:hypothetical protein